MVHIPKHLKGCKNNTECDALLINTNSRTDTYPAITVRGDDNYVQHEASVSKVNEEMIFYMQQRGLTEGQAMSLAVNGFINDLAPGEVADGFGTVDHVSNVHVLVDTPHDDVIYVDATYTNSAGSAIAMTAADACMTMVRAAPRRTAASSSNAPCAAGSAKTFERISTWPAMPLKTRHPETGYARQPGARSPLTPPPRSAQKPLAV